jgi:hypothetical protein
MSDRIKELKAQIKQLDDDHDEVSKLYHETVNPLRQELAVLVCPVKVRDKIKSRGDAFVVTRITAGRYSNDFTIYVRRVLKDGDRLHSVESTYTLGYREVLFVDGTWDGPLPGGE